MNFQNGTVGFWWWVLFCFVEFFFLYFSFFSSMCVIKKTYWKEEYVVDLVSVSEMREFPRVSSGSVFVLSWKEVIDSSHQHTSLILLNKSFALFLSITLNIHILKTLSYMSFRLEKKSLHTANIWRNGKRSFSCASQKLKW